MLLTVLVSVLAIAEVSSLRVVAKTRAGAMEASVALPDFLGETECVVYVDSSWMQLSNCISADWFFADDEIVGPLSLAIVSRDSIQGL